MTQLTAPRAKRRKGTLPAFAPVPRHYNRHDGWTPERQRAFIEALADTGSVKSAARAVNMAPEGAYQLRRHPEGGEFRKAWEAALALGVQKIEDVAMERALNGVEVPVYHFGQIVGTRKVYNDYLLMFMLRNRAPKRFAADTARGLSAMDRTYLNQQKKEWRKQWERDQALRQAEASKNQKDTLTENLTTMHRRWYCDLLPEARAAYRRFRELEEEQNALPRLNFAQSEAERAEAAAEYEEWFGENRDRRPKIWRLVDLREWEVEDRVDRLNEAILNFGAMSEKTGDLYEAFRLSLIEDRARIVAGKEEEARQRESRGEPKALPAPFNARDTSRAAILQAIRERASGERASGESEES